VLGFVEDTIDTIHTSGRDSCLGVDDVESRSNCLYKVAHVCGDWMSIAVEDADEDRPGVKLLDGCLQRGWESHIRGCESLGICEGQVGARLSYFRLLDHELDCLRLGMAFTHASKGGQTFSKGNAGTSRLEGTENLVRYLGSRQATLRQPAVKGTSEA
jgi:hypothetical protein